MSPAATWKPHTRHGERDTDDRASLPDSINAFPKQRKEPLTDAAPVKNALAQFDQVTDVSDADRDVAMYAAALARRYRPDHIVLFGRSLGAAVAIEVARQQPAGAVIRETPFLSIPTLARALYPWVPPILVRSRFDNASKIQHVLAPKLIVHGDRDEVVPLAHAQRLFELALEPKRFVLIRMPARTTWC